MSIKDENISCARCHAYLFPEDDIVYCPVCGAPHHRECYSADGHCALEALHGTDRQYDKVKEAEEAKAASAPEETHTGENAQGLISCRMCREQYDFSLNACPKCGAPNIAKAGGSFVNFDFLGGVPADYDIGDGVTADEAKRLVAVNTQRYIPKFASIGKKSKSSWNWAAFLFPCGWMLSRKMYKNGIIAGVFTVIASLLNLPFLYALQNLGYTDNMKSYSELLTPENLVKIGAAAILAMFLGSAVNIVTRIISAVLGDNMYKNYTVNAVKEIRAQSEDMDSDYRKKGGVNLFMFILGTFAIQYLPQIIAIFI